MADKREHNPPTPFLGKQGRAACETVGHRLARHSEDREGLVTAFGVLFECTWRDLSSVIGTKGISAVVQRAQFLLRPQHAVLALVDVDERAVHLERLRRSELEVVLIGDALTAVFVTTMEIMASLIGYDLVAPSVQRIEADLRGRGLQ